MRDFMPWHKTLRLPAALFAAVMAGPPAAAEEGLRRHFDVVAERAIDGDTLALRDGRALRLAGVLAPKPGDTGLAKDIAAIARTAADDLASLARGNTLQLFIGEIERDRHGRLIAQARLADGRWLQDELLRRGLARVFTQPGLAARATAMLAAENAARAARRGLWALPSYAVIGAAEAGRAYDRFAIVEGTVLRAARAREFFYLNFEPDWRRDFTIGFDAEALRRFRRAGFDPALLDGKRVRVRGWIVARNGPYIGATYPEQIEVLE